MIYFSLSSPFIKTCRTKNRSSSSSACVLHIISSSSSFAYKVPLLSKKSGGCVFVRLPTHDVILDGMLAFYIHYFYIMHQASFLCIHRFSLNLANVKYVDQFRKTIFQSTIKINVLCNGSNPFFHQQNTDLSIYNCKH